MSGWESGGDDEEVTGVGILEGARVELRRAQLLVDP